MDTNHTIYNSNLIKLNKKLNSMGIKSNSYNNNNIEIFYNEEQKELILNMISQIDTSKNGFIFKSHKDGEKNIKSVLITFYRDMNLNCELLNGYLENRYDLSNLNNFNKIDIILDSLSYTDMNFAIKKNYDILDKYLVTFNFIMTKEQLENNNNFVLNNEELNPRLIHTICQKNEDNTYNVTYSLLYENENDLDNLLTIKNENTNTKKLVKQLI